MQFGGQSGVSSVPHEGLLQGFVRPSSAGKPTREKRRRDSKLPHLDERAKRGSKVALPRSSREIRALIMSGQMFDLVLHVISKPPEHRTSTEVDVLIPWLRKKSDMLNTLNKTILTMLVKSCTHEKVTRDEVIIRQGDRGDCFYIQLTGKTSLYIESFDSHEPPKNEEQQKEEEEDVADSLFYIQLSGKSSLYIDTAKSDHDGPNKSKKDELTAQEALLEEIEEEQRMRTGKKKKLDRAQFGKYILNFDPGKSFGEIALMTTEAIRNASIVADEDTDLLVIDRELFNQTLKAKQEADYAERKAFIDSTSLFDKWSSRFKRLLEMSIRKEVFLFDDVIVKQGEPVQGIHFVLRGQAKLLVDPEAHRQQFPRIYEASTEAFARELGIKITHKEKHKEEGTQQPQVRVRRKDGYAAAEKRLAQKSTTLCFLDEKEIIGDAEIVLGLEQYTSTVVCTAPTEVFILDNKNIERLIQKKNRPTLELLRAEVQSKIQGRHKTQLGSHIELYQHLLVKLEELKPKTYNTRPSEKSEQDPKLQSRDVMLGQLVKLFLENKSPMIEPSVPGAVFYMTKSSDKAKRFCAEKLRKKEVSMMSKAMTGEVRLQRARKATRRHPRSRRELERLTIAQDTEGIKPLQDRHSAVNRFLNNGNNGVTRPHTASGYNSRSRATTKGSDDNGIFHLTEPDLPDIDEPDGQVVLGSSDITEQGAMKNIVLNMADHHQIQNSSRAKIICSMIERRTNHPNAVSGLMRPKSAPGHIGHASDDDDDDEAFDQDTSEHALRDLEERLRAFHQHHDSNGRKVHAKVTELRRFSIQRPEEVPIPGGTVYIRQRPCRYQGGGAQVSSSHHQHIRRYMIPRDAASIATKSMAMLEQANHNGVEGPYSERPPPVPVRPHTAIGGAGRGQGRNNTQKRIQSAKNGQM